jgi:hypothetical protein
MRPRPGSPAARAPPCANRPGDSSRSADDRRPR